MQFIKKNLLSATLFIIVAFILILVAISSDKNENSTIPKRAKLELVQESEWSSPLSSSIPVNEREAIMDKLKAGGWFSTTKKPSGEYEIFSQNGKRKGLIKFLGDPKQEDFIELSLLDDKGSVAWKNTVGSKIRLSNNGQNFTADYGTGCLLSFYNIKKGSSPLFTTDECYDDYRFSEDGEYFLAAGRFLDLYTADGKLIWRKSTGTPAYKLLATTDDFSRIAVISNTGVFSDSTPNFKDVDWAKLKEEKLQLEIDRKKFREQIKLNEGRNWPFPDKRILAEKATGVEPAVPRKCFLTVLNGDGLVISQIELNYPLIEGIAFLPNEPNLILIDARINLLLIDGQTKSTTWKYPEDINHLYQITNIDFSKDGEIISMGVISDANRKDSPRYVILLNKNGDLLQKIEIKDTYKSQLGGPMAFFGEKEYLLVRSQNQMWVYKISYID